MDDGITGEQTQALILLAEALDALGVEYYRTGSVAAGLYGDARMSNDIDVVIEVPRQRGPLVKVLSEDFEADAEIVDEALRDRRMFNLLSPVSLAKIDVIPRVPKLDSDDVLTRRHRISLGDGVICVISPEDLVVAKLQWSKDSRSEMQQRDIWELLARADIDLRYIERKAAKLGLTEWFREVRRARHE